MTYQEMRASVLDADINPTLRYALLDMIDYYNEQIEYLERQIQDIEANIDEIKG